MSSIAPGPIQLQVESSLGRKEKSKKLLLMVCNAFWHTLRRDLTVTAREFVPFLLQVLVMPLSLLFIFGRLLPGVGMTQQMYPAMLFPGVVAFTIFMAGIQGITPSLMLDLDTSHEIDDRLLAPMTVSLVAVEKIVFASIRSLAAAALLFVVAYLVLGKGYQVRTDSIVTVVGISVLYSLSSAALGLLIGSALPKEKIYLLFSLIFSATLYTGCVYYTWMSISSIKVLQILTLLNPMTYASEGLRYAMVPLAHGQVMATLPLGWVLVGLTGSFIAFLVLGIRAFHKRVIS